MGKRTIMFFGLVFVFAMALGLPSILYAEDGGNPAKKIGGVWIGYDLFGNVNTLTVTPTNNSSGRSFTLTMSHVNAFTGADPHSYHGEGIFTGPDTYEGVLMYHNTDEIRICKYRGRVMDENTLVENHWLSIFLSVQDSNPKDGMPDEGQIPVFDIEFETILSRMVPAALPLELEFPEYPVP